MTNRKYAGGLCGGGGADCLGVWRVALAWVLHIY